MSDIYSTCSGWEYMPHPSMQYSSATSQADSHKLSSPGQKIVTTEQEVGEEVDHPPHHQHTPTGHPKLKHNWAHTLIQCSYSIYQAFYCGWYQQRLCYKNTLVCVCVLVCVLTSLLSVPEGESCRNPQYHLFSSFWLTAVETHCTRSQGDGGGARMQLRIAAK